MNQNNTVSFIDSVKIMVSHKDSTSEELKNNDVYILRDGDKISVDYNFSLIMRTSIRATHIQFMFQGLSRHIIPVMASSRMRTERDLGHGRCPARLTMNTTDIRWS